MLFEAAAVVVSGVKYIFKHSPRLIKPTMATLGFGLTLCILVAAAERGILLSCKTGGSLFFILIVCPSLWLMVAALASRVTALFKRRQEVGRYISPCNCFFFKRGWDTHGLFLASLRGSVPFLSLSPSSRCYPTPLPL